MASEQQQAWKFWHPLSFWKVVLIFVLTNLAVTVVWVVLREALKLNLPGFAAGGAGGLVAVLIVSNLARKAREAESPKP